MATPSSALAWKIPWMEEPGELWSMGSLWVGHDWATSLSLFTFMHWRRKWQPIPMFLPGESQGQRSLVGFCLGSHIVEHDWSDLAAAAEIINSLDILETLTQLNLQKNYIAEQILKIFYFSVESIFYIFQINCTHKCSFVFLYWLFKRR